MMTPKQLKIAKEALLEAIKIIGGQVRTGKKCKVSQPTVSGWVARGYSPTGQVLTLQKESGIPRHRLRPDIYPD